MTKQSIRFARIIAAFVVLVSAFAPAPRQWVGAPQPVQADSTYHQLCVNGTPNNFSQNWASASLITTNNDWSGVTSIEGFRGDGLASTGTDPQTILADGTTTPINVIAQSAASSNTGGIHEIEISDVVALQGSSTADAPHLNLYLDTTGATAVSISYNLRELDTSNAVQQFALHYRVGSSGNYTNIPAGYVADAANGSSLVTPVSNVALPAGGLNQGQVQVRIMTVDATGHDSMVGIDDIVISATCSTLTPGVTITESSGSTDVDETGPTTDTYTIALNTTPAGSVTITATADADTEVSNDGINFGTTAAVVLTDTTPATITVRAVDDGNNEGPHTSTITHAITTTNDTTDYPLSTVIDDVTANVTDNDAPLPTIVINEINADISAGYTGDANNDGVRSSNDDEFIELVNNNGSPLDISGWTISDASSTRFTFPSGTVIPDQCAVVVFGGGTPMGFFGGAQVFTTGSLGFNDTGDTITIRDGSNTVIASYTYYSQGESEGDNDQAITRMPDITGADPLVLHGQVAAGSPSSSGSRFSPGTQANGTAFSGCAVAAFTLTVTTDNNITNLAENGGTLDATVTRSGSTTGDLVVTLLSDDTSEATVPVTVTILDGNASADFTITGVDDAISDGDQQIVISAGVAGVTDTVSVALDVTDDEADKGPGATRIRAIQGAGHTAAITGAVTDVPGIVTQIAARGFYMQDPEPDTNDATSEGIFVFTSDPPEIEVGDLVLVSGTASEFFPDGTGGDGLSITQISNSPTIEEWALSLPATSTITPTVIGAGGRVPPSSVIDNDSFGTFDPAEDGIDFWESLEGMLVQINNPLAVSPTNKFGEIWVLADNGTGATTLSSRNSLAIAEDDFNPERIQLDDDDRVALNPNVSSGAALTGPLTGVVHYSFDNYEVLLGARPDVTSDPLTRETTTVTGGGANLTVATLNVENLDPNDADGDWDVATGKFDELADVVVNRLGNPDIVVLQEIQDNNGATNDGTVAADVTLQTLVDAITAASGPTYAFTQIDPTNNADGGQPGANIRVAFLYNPTRVTFNGVAGATATTAATVTCTGGSPSLNFNPVRIDPTNTAFASSRKPLLGEFIFNDGTTNHTVFVVALHMNSKGGDNPLFGRFQPPVLISETQRIQQAAVIANFLKNGSTGLLDCNPAANVILTGDFNDFQFSTPLNNLEAIGLTTLIEAQLPATERYSYNYQGNAQALDHIQTSPTLISRLLAFDVVHVNSEFFDQVSDHDPSIAAFDFLKPGYYLNLFLPIISRAP